MCKRLHFSQGIERTDSAICPPAAKYKSDILQDHADDIKEARFLLSNAINNALYEGF